MVGTEYDELSAEQVKLGVGRNRSEKAYISEAVQHVPGTLDYHHRGVVRRPKWDG